MGRASKQKGYRGEILLRDALRAQGFEANRQPMSGAIKGFEGDIEFSRNSMRWLAELKCRRDEYAGIYEMFAALKHSNHLPIAHPSGVESVSIHEDMDSALFGVLAHTALEGLEKFPGWRPKFARTIRKVFGMRPLLGKSDILVIKGDRLPFLYLRYQTMEAQWDGSLV